MNRIVAKVDGREFVIPLGLRKPTLGHWADYEYWLKLENEYALNLKKAVESGDISVNSIEEEMIKWSILVEDNFNRYEEKGIEDCLLRLDFQIRYSLLNNTPPRYFIDLFGQLYNLEFTAKMILKHPQIVETIALASNYEVYIPAQCTSRQMAEAIIGEQEIKKQADIIMRKLKQIFKVPDDKSFVEVFQEHLKLFHDN